MGRPKWSFTDCVGAHGRQVCWGSMHTDQHTNRGGIKAQNPVALRAVLWHSQVLPQRGEGLRRRDSARRREQSHLQPASSEFTAVGRPEKQRSFSSDSPSRKRAAAGKQSGRKYASSADIGNCVDRAQREPRNRDTFSQGGSRNRQAQQTARFVVSRLRCSSNSNQTASQRKASWHGKETYATQMARTGALAQ